MVERKTLEALTKDDLRELIEVSASPVASLFQPTFRAGRDVEQNGLRFKNLLTEAEELIESEFDRATGTKLLGSIRDLLGDGDFWRQQLDGLAIISSLDKLWTLRLPFDLPERVVVGDRAHILPLLPALDAQRRVFILALSGNAVRLWEASGYGIEEVDLSELEIPRSLAEALRYDDYEKTDLQHHPASPATSGGARVLFHGHGPGSEDQKNEILRYFQAIDSGISKLLANRTEPLILAAVDYLHALYRQANNYRHLSPVGIEGNADHMNAQSLKERASGIIAGLEERRNSEVVARYRALEGTGRSSDRAADIVAAARAGRVEVLLVPYIHGTARRDDESLLNLAAVETLTHGGETLALEEGDLPTKSGCAATYRF